ncbi:MAG: hypothetical protein AAFV19_06340 [Pseudomonadota bacterium]
MSTNPTTSSIAKRGSGNEILVIGGVIVAVLALLWLFNFDSNRALQRSASGYNGLVSWLRGNDIEARSFRGGARLTQGTIGVRILPLFDVDLKTDQETPTTRAEVIAQTTEKDLELWIFEEKISSLPTLVVLPKWRAGMRMLSVAHKDLLIPEQDLNRLLSQIGMPVGRLRRDPGGFADVGHGIAGQEFRIGVLHTQTLRNSGCKTLLGLEDAQLLVECKAFDGNVYWVLADPDVLNNHGLSRSENADAALAILQAMEDSSADIAPASSGSDGEEASASHGVDLSKPVVVDHTNRFLTVEDGYYGGNDYERDWNDFGRMFVWPFTMIWIAFALVGALVLWRAFTRYGPLARVYEDEPRASKEISIAAKARLLRLSNHDGALLEAHIKARLGQLASDLLGPHRPADQDPLEVLTRLVSRKSPELAQELADASATPRHDSGDLLHHLDRFEDCYNKVHHEFGRTPVAG